MAFIKDSFLQYNRIDPNKNFNNFVTGPTNKLAFEASKKVSEDISHYNPLYVYGGWLKLMKNYKVVKQSGPICKYVDTSTGEEVTFYGKELQQLCEERPEVREQMYKDTCDQYVMKYQHEDEQEMDPDVQIEESGE